MRAHEQSRAAGEGGERSRRASQVGSARGDREGLAAAWGGVANQRRAWPTPLQEQLLRATLLEGERALQAWSAVREQLGLSAAGDEIEARPPALDPAASALLPALHRNLSRLHVEDPLLASMQSAHQTTWLHNRRLLGRVAPGMRALVQAGIPTLVVKGAALIARGSFDSGLRAITDVDVVVPTAQLPQAIDVLAQSGFRPVGGVPAWYVCEYAGRFVPSHAFAGAENAQLDLHWHVLHDSCQPDADEELWAERTPARLSNVQTSVLCATDELLLAILHGLRWSERPTYRWVLDAAQLMRGEHGPVDYERLLLQASRRRVRAAVGAGLAYLRDLLDAPIPPGVLRALARPGVLERLELRARLTDPRARGALAQALLQHQQYVRRALPLARRSSLRVHVRLAREHLGLARLRDARLLLEGGTPGPGRPPSTVAAAIGTGSVPATVAPLRLGEPLVLGDADVAGAHVRYGTWLSEAGECWTAGVEACLQLALEPHASSTLLLCVSAGGYLPLDGRRQRLRLCVNGREVGAAQLDSTRPELEEEAFVVPREALAGGAPLELLVGTPDAVSPAQLGLAPDDRRLGVSLRRLLVRAPRRQHSGEPLRFGDGSHDEQVLAGGWSRAEEDGRWTCGPRSSLLVLVGEDPPSLELQLRAVPFLGPNRHEVEVSVLANDHAIGALSFQRDARDAKQIQERTLRLAIPPGAIGPAGELLLSFAVEHPRSPLQEGVSDDRRELGMFVRELTLGVAR